MSLKQKEEITIWAFKDGKKGHEKQVEALISELSLYKKINLHASEDSFISLGDAATASLISKDSIIKESLEMLNEKK